MSKYLTKSLRTTLLAAGALSFVSTTAVWAQETPPKDEEPKKKEPAEKQDAEASEDGEKKADEKDKKKKDKPKFKKYEDIITEKAETKEGLWTTHEVDGKLYYELDEDTFDTEYLWLVQYSKMQSNFGYAGTQAARRHVKFERIDDSIVVRNMEYQMRADDGTPEAMAVADSSVPNILAAFKIVTFKEGAQGKPEEQKNPVIDVTKFFKSTPDELSPKKSLNATATDPNRTFISSVKTFEKNIETRVLTTFKLKPTPPSRSSGSTSPLRKDSSLTSATVELHHSIIELPRDKMRPRYHDARVGMFRDSHADFSSDKGKMETKTIIQRYRVEKVDPSAKMSEVKNPIVFYVDPSTPEKFQKYVKEGIEIWQAAFESAGMKNAIIGKYAPTKEEDPDWDTEDVTVSSITWLASGIANAYGPRIADPRTGEILEADVRMYHNVQEWLKNAYFVQASPSDKGARKLPLDDSRLGELIKYVVAHEVGHSIGFRHNMLASSSYPVEKYRDKKFIAKNGVEASIMDYARFNYIAQPGDDMEFTAVVGPYDHFAVQWAYGDFAGTTSPEDDEKHLNKLANKQLKNKTYRFGGAHEDGYDGRADHRAQTEDISDNAVRASTYGFKNLETVMGYIVDGTVTDNEDYTLLGQIYGSLVNQMRQEAGHVANVIGSVTMDNVVAGQGKPKYRVLGPKEQISAINFLNNKVFQTPTFLLQDDVIEKLGVKVVSDRIMGMQTRTMGSLLSKERIDRMFSIEAAGKTTYTPWNFLNLVQRDLFDELAGNKRTDAYRRNLQRYYVNTMLGYIGDGSTGATDLQALSRSKMNELVAEIDAKVGRMTSMDQAHYANLKLAITDAFEGKRPVKPAAAGPTRRFNKWDIYEMNPID